MTQGNLCPIQFSLFSKQIYVVLDSILLSDQLLLMKLQGCTIEIDRISCLNS